VSEGDPSGDPGLDQPGIVVGKPALRPGPVGLGREPTEPRVRADEQILGFELTGVAPRHLGRPEERIGVRPRRGGVEGRSAQPKTDESTTGELAGPLAGGNPEPEESTSLRVIRSLRVGPAAVEPGGAPVAKATVRTLRALEKAQVDAGQAGGLRGACPELTRRRPERARDVIGAVAMLDARSREPRMLEDADRVTQRREVRERRVGQAQPTTAVRARRTSSVTWR
jgi:hypothetical protein